MGRVGINAFIKKYPLMFYLGLQTQFPSSKGQEIKNIRVPNSQIKASQPLLWQSLIMDGIKVGR